MMKALLHCKKIYYAKDTRVRLQDHISLSEQLAKATTSRDREQEYHKSVAMMMDTQQQQRQRRVGKDMSGKEEIYRRRIQSRRLFERSLDAGEAAKQKRHRHNITQVGNPGQAETTCGKIDQSQGQTRTQPERFLYSTGTGQPIPSRSNALGLIPAEEEKRGDSREIASRERS